MMMMIVMITLDFYRTVIICTGVFTVSYRLYRCVYSPLSSVQVRLQSVIVCTGAFTVRYRLYRCVYSPLSSVQVRLQSVIVCTGAFTVSYHLYRCVYNQFYSCVLIASQKRCDRNKQSVLC